MSVSSKPVTLTSVQAMPRPASGWTVPALSNNIPIIYVDNVAGVDVNDGTRVFRPAQTGGVPATPACAVLPVRTLNFARDLMLATNGGMNGRPGRILPKRGRTFTEEAKILDGASTTDRFVLEAWGDPTQPRPIIDHDGCIQSNSGASHAAVLHISLRCSAYTGSNISPYGMCIRGWINDLVVEGCDAYRMWTPFNFEGDGSSGQTLTFNRNVVRENWRAESGDSGNPVGLYVANGVASTQDRNVFYHCGWRIGDLRTAYTNYVFRLRGRYIQNNAGPAHVTNESVGDTFSDGIRQGSGGSIRGGYYFHQPMSILMGNGGLVDGATIEDSCNIRDDNANYSRGHAVQWTGGTGGRGRRILAHGFRPRPDPVNKMCFGFVEGSNNGTLDGCVAGAGWPTIPIGGSPFCGLGGGYVGYDVTKNNAPTLLGNNQFGAVPSAVRRLEDYLASIGVTPGADPYAAYGALLAEQRYGHWDPRLEGDSVAAYERAVWAIPGGSGN